MSQPTVSIVIPNMNGAAYLRACLESVRKQQGVTRVIVVDNASTDGSDAMVKEIIPDAQLIRFETNTGFCGAVNAGIAASMDLDYVILLNNDTVIEPDFTRYLVEAMADENVFSAQARMLSMQDASVIDDAGDLYCALGWAFAYGKGKKDGPRYQKSRRLFSCCAGAAIYRISMLKEIGVFDEAHFAYLEDLDIGWRARLNGYMNIYEPRAVVHHVGSASSGSIYNLFKVRNSSRNSIYVIGKNMPWWQVILNLPLLIPGYLVKTLFFILKGYGKDYIAGIGKGVALSIKGAKEGKKAFKGLKKLPYCLRLQLELWFNLILRLKQPFDR
ncbi:MAG: glycosyltransferase family 2 protein [Lachnospiraceae bacterium]|nr:glycosyltransferase family 2 protein [Candidatus Equihabitans merdae]